MARVPFTMSLRKEYENLFNGCRIRPERLNEVESIIAKLQANKSRYQNVGGGLGIPWFFVAAIHNMESSLSFAKCLSRNKLYTLSCHDILLSWRKN